ATFCGVRAYWDGIAPTNPPEHLKFQRLYFCSKALRKLTASAGFEVMHGAVIYAPVDTAKFQGVAKNEAHPVQKLLWVGRLSQDKGVMTALKAMKQLEGKFSGELHIYGKGDSDYVAELKKFVKDHHLRVSFSCAGMDEMPSIYRSYDALLFTSEWAEPFALTPLEAMSTGLPVIATTTGGSREIFRHRDNALTYNAGHADELAQRIVDLSTQPALRVRIAQTGQAEVQVNYALPVIVDQIEKYLGDTLANWQAPGLRRYTA
ncbi:MAG TPA: glycosyltransferase family 4 protein, partial [Verrucomicrobiae bacterium]|nr:glycosyltransferase family 4 protein [Verrucomicrobiae bacterium]